ncbi:hypothetical protein OS175_07625 [Marinicella sp. S1101]|uniref:ATP-grasp domain-containing protein n=1 Tax=Marinicella marina TaxID=2996016 RepID=UPI0022609885|nr:hypothetical protein [Marinicella marina]MCX7553744.1 hypothetical protein [Marinicella marina]MDJ1140819.1 hypothetical protein [Marinicella marina]
MQLAIITCSSLPEGVADDQPLFESLRAIGFDVDILPWDSAVDWSKFDAALIRSVWDYHERHSAFNCWLKKVSSLTHLINPIRTIQWNSNKIYLRELGTSGIRTAPTVWINENNQNHFNEFINDTSAEQYFLKPVIGADSSGTFRFADTPNDIQQAQQHLKQWLPQFEMMLQPYMKSVETYGETSLIYFAGRYSHAVRKIPQLGDYRVQDTFGAQDITHQPNEDELLLSEQCLRHMASHKLHAHYARFDFLNDEKGQACLNEAELIEPSLFFNHGPNAAFALANVIQDYLSTG